MKTKLFFICLLMYTGSLVAQQKFAFKYDLLGLNRKLNLEVEYLANPYVGIAFGVLYHHDEIVLDRVGSFSLRPSNPRAFSFKTLSLIGDARFYIPQRKKRKHSFFVSPSVAFVYMSGIDKAYYDAFRERFNEEQVDVSRFYPQFRLGFLAGVKLEMAPKVYVEPSFRFLSSLEQNVAWGLDPANDNVVGRVFYVHLKLVYQIN